MRMKTKVDDSKCLLFTSQIHYPTRTQPLSTVIINTIRTICSFEPFRSKLLLGSSKENAMSLQAIFFLSLDLRYDLEEKNIIFSCSYYILQYANFMGKSNQNKSQSSPSLPFKCISSRKVTSSWLLAAASVRACHSSFARATRMKCILFWWCTLMEIPSLRGLTLFSWPVAPLPKKAASFRYS